MDPVKTGGPSGDRNLGDYVFCGTEVDLGLTKKKEGEKTPTTLLENKMSKTGDQ